MASRIQYILAKSLKEAHRFAQDVLGLDRGHYRVVNSPSTLTSVRYADLHLVPGWDNRFDKFPMRGALKWTKMNVITHLAEGLSVPMIDESCKCGTPESQHHSVDPPHMFAPQGSDSTPESVPDGLNPPGEQLIFITEPPGDVPVGADEASAFFDASNGDTMISEGGPVPPEEAPVVEKPLDDPFATPLADDEMMTPVLGNLEDAPKPKRVRRKRCPHCSGLFLKENFDNHPCPTRPQED